MKKTYLALLVPCILCAVDSDNKTTLLEDIQQQIQYFQKDANSSTSTEAIAKLKSYFDNMQLDDTFDKSSIADEFKLLSHHRNYILPISYDSRSHNDNRKSAEAQFQVSLKVPLYQRLFGSVGDLFVAYTQNSYWQVYDNKNSAPFRETNYQPEIFLNFSSDKKITDNLTLLNTRIALIHQSNGKSAPLSRSWNKTELEMIFGHIDGLRFGFNIWNRFDEEAKPSPSSSQGDDNPDLQKFIGRQKYSLGYKTDAYSWNISHQNDIGGYNINYGNIKSEFTFPSFNKNFRWYVNHFYGYGESLIDYNEKTNKIGFGVLVAEGML